MINTILRNTVIWSVSESKMTIRKNNMVNNDHLNMQHTDAWREKERNVFKTWCNTPLENV